MSVTITVTLPEELAQALRRAAIRNERSMSGEVRAALRDRLSTPYPEPRNLSWPTEAPR